MKKFPLQTMELAEAAVKDAVNFGLTASLQKEGDVISVAYESPAVASPTNQQISWDDVYSVMKSVSSEYEYQLKWLREDVQYAREAFYKHLNGHIPSITDAGIMKKALKALGLEDSFEVRKPAVYVEY